MKKPRRDLSVVLLSVCLAAPACGPKDETTDAPYHLVVEGFEDVGDSSRGLMGSAVAGHVFDQLANTGVDVSQALLIREHENVPIVLLDGTVAHYPSHVVLTVSLRHAGDESPGAVFWTRQYTEPNAPGSSQLAHMLGDRVAVDAEDVMMSRTY